MRWFIRTCDSISEWTGRIFAWLVVPITAIIVLEVIWRRLFHSPHIWIFEITTCLYSIHFMMVSAYTLLYNAHVNVDCIYSQVSRRWQAAIDVVSYLIFFFPFFITLLIAGTDTATDSWVMGEKTMTANLPLIMPALKTVIPIASFLLLLQGLSHLVRSLFFVVRGREI